MNEEMIKSKVYIKTDNQNRIIYCDGGYTIDNIENIDEWTLIDEGEGVRFNLCQSNYFDGGLYTDDGIPRWKYVGGECVLRNDDELSVDRASMPASAPTQLDRIEAQVMYTALVTDSLLGEGK